MANTTYEEFTKRVMLHLQPRVDGTALMAAKEAINDAHYVIACVKDFDELLVLDTTHAATVDGTKLYHIEDDLDLVRPKDIYSIRLMDEDNSRKLIYVPFRELDLRVPYTEQTGEGRPKWYTVRGRYIELYRIPDDAYSLYIQHSQWPTVLSDDTDTTDYEHIDYVIIALATEMALASLEGGGSNWTERAKQLLGMALNEDVTRPDRKLVAQPFRAEAVGAPGEYWNNPWVKNQP